MQFNHCARDFVGIVDSFESDVSLCKFFSNAIESDDDPTRPSKRHYLNAYVSFTTKRCVQITVVGDEVYTRTLVRIKPAIVKQK